MGSDQNGNSRKPKDSDFYQQRLKAWQPILTPKWVVITFLGIGVIFTPLGFVLKAASDSVVEYSYRYDNQCAMGGATSVRISVTEDMNPPVYVYYELDNFYQNHRRYVKSRDDSQLKGEIKSEGDLSDCDPLKKRDGKILHPCGLIANSFFNDTIQLNPVVNSENVLIVMNETDIAWDTDKDKFEKVPPEETKQYSTTHQFLYETYPEAFEPPFVDPNCFGGNCTVNNLYQGVENEHFIVWMRTAALPKFRKLFGRIEQKVTKGTTLTFNLTCHFPVSPFDGRKELVVSTTSWLGGKNAFLGISYIVVGFLCIALGIAFALKQKFCGRRLGDTDFLVWTRR